MLILTRPTRLAAASFAVAAAGCSYVEDYVEPLAGQFVVVAALEPHDSMGIELPATLSAFAQVSEAQITTDLADLAVDDAQVEIEVPGVGAFPLTAAGHDGVYHVTLSDPALVFEQGRIHTFRVTVGDRSGTASMPMPSAPTFDLPEVVAAGQEVDVLLEGGPYDAVVAAVVDDSGQITHASWPDTVEEILAVVEGEPVDRIVLPSEAFPEPGRAYLVGISGLVAAEHDAFDGLNIASSHLMAGAMRFKAVVAQ